jgi:hypothetical protein
MAGCKMFSGLTKPLSEKPEMDIGEQLFLLQKASIMNAFSQ